MDWQQFFITVIGTAIGVALTFVVNGILERRSKAQAQRLTAIMVIHDMDHSIDIVKALLDSSHDKMEWTQPNGTVRYLKRKRE